METVMTNEAYNNTLDEAKHLAYSDYLTGLASRRGLYEYYDSMNKSMVVHAMFIDIDNFKRVNDVYGHKIGDEVIVMISRLINGCVDGFTARIGGDEYVVLIDGNKREEEVVDIAQKLLDNMPKVEFRKDILSHISLSIGIVMHQKVNASLDDVLHKCDVAMYQAKYDGKNRYVVYHEYEKTIERTKSIEAEMEYALETGQFKVFLQPKVNMITSKLYGAEALSRWMHPEDGLRSPGVYIPVFEKNGFISKLDMYVFEEVCRLKREWTKAKKKYAHVLISVNMSRLHLYNEKFPDMLANIANKYQVDHKELEIEITEGVFVKDSTELIRNVKLLREYDFQVSIDDFGSGFSALNLLKDLPVNTIKIDQGFLHGSGNTQRGKKVIRNVIAMCLDLKLDVVTEGIETKEQKDFITKCGCQIAQGFYYAKPLCIEDFIAFADEYMINVLSSYSFRLNGSLKSEDGSMQASINGDGLEYQDGVFSDSKSIYFPGGPQEKNTVFIPPEAIVNDSFTVSMWIRPKELHMWACACYIKFESGFAAIIPQAWEGQSDFRIRDSREVTGWYDLPALQLQENTWSHYTISYNAKTETATSFINGDVVNILENVPTNRYVKWIIVGGDVFQPSFIGNICEIMIYNECKDYLFVKDLYLSYKNHENYIG